MTTPPPSDRHEPDASGMQAGGGGMEPRADCGCAADTPSGAADALVLRRTLTIRNSRGLHARAAAKLATLAERYSACLRVTRGGQTVPACSIMGLMMLGAGPGSEITIEAEGWDAKEALEAITGLVEAGFHES